jgi:penicillin-binding protein 1A
MVEPPLRKATPARRALDLLAWLGAVLVLYVLLLIPFTPSGTHLRQVREGQPSVMVSAEGQVLARFTANNHDWQPLDRISPYVVQALVATEDRRFYHHIGVDPLRIVAAGFNTLQGDREGGSTITQQLARNLYPEEIGNAPTLTRKLREAITALKIEVHASKQEVLETYLNTVPFLYNATGIEMAARTYFGKTAAQLDVLESATLVAMLKGTSYYNPMVHPERALERRNLVLQLMAQHGDIDDAAMRRLQARPLRVDFEVQREDLGPAPHLARQVRRWLADWADRHGRSVDTDGLVVRTTLNAHLQATANNVLAHQLGVLQPAARAVSRDQPLQSGFLALDPRNGHVLAWVGSRDFASSQFDHVEQARRQPGSTFKPFVYGAAFAAGMKPADTFVDQPVAIRNGRDTWRPQDASAPTMQPMTLADGLAYSRNTITAQVMQQVGAARVARFARDLGVRDSKLDAVPSLALGTSPVSLKEMVTAYGSIANGGSYLEPVIITQVEDRRGRVLEAFAPPRPQRALDARTSLMVVDAMRGVVNRGTGHAVRDRYGITADVAGKTGTSQDNMDGWFLLMHPQLVAGAWVGFDDSRLRMGDSWGPGASSALPMVAEFFQQALGARWIDPNASFGQPELALAAAAAAPQAWAPAGVSGAAADATATGSAAAAVPQSPSAPDTAVLGAGAPPSAAAAQAGDPGDEQAEPDRAAPRRGRGHHAGRHGQHAGPDRHRGHGRGHGHGRRRTLFRIVIG